MTLLKKPWQPGLPQYPSENFHCYICQKQCLMPYGKNRRRKFHRTYSEQLDKEGEAKVEKKAREKYGYGRIASWMPR